MESNQDVFRFDLDESLYFAQGQEISEMTGISLDPDISIQPLHDYISIRGVIELQGSYLKKSVSEPENVSDLADDQAKRYMENVVNLDENEAQFSHRFPVEISVPAHRVHNTDDVTVSIESFDYELASSSQLKLSSTIEIRGISADTSTSSTDDIQAGSTAELSNSGESFTFDLNMKQDNEGGEPETNDTTPPPVLSQEESASEQRTEQTSEQERWKHKKSQTFAEFFGTEEKESQENTEQEILDPASDTVESSMDSETIAELSESGHDEENEDEDNSVSVEDIRYLADMFGDDEETYTKMRLRIVQKDDTVASIAERYEISEAKLLNQNQFAQDGLEEGQLLYIPQTKKQS